MYNCVVDLVPNSESAVTISHIALLRRLFQFIVGNTANTTLTIAAPIEGEAGPSEVTVANARCA